MSLMLQVVIALAVVVLTATLVPLLMQLRRTALVMADFAERASHDLNQVASDVHATRARIDSLADLAQAHLEHPAPLAQVVLGLASAVPAFFRPAQQGANWMELLVTGLRTILSLFHGAPEAASQEVPHA